jgi:hypothetical protein
MRTTAPGWPASIPTDADLHPRNARGRPPDASLSPHGERASIARGLSLSRCRRLPSGCRPSAMQCGSPARGSGKPRPGPHQRPRVERQVPSCAKTRPTGKRLGDHGPAALPHAPGAPPDGGDVFLKRGELTPRRGNVPPPSRGHLFVDQRRWAVGRSPAQSRTPGRPAC